MPLLIYYYHVKSIKNKINKYEKIEEKIDYLYLKKHKKELDIREYILNLKIKE